MNEYHEESETEKSMSSILKHLTNQTIKAYDNSNKLVNNQRWLYITGIKIVY